MSNFKSLEAEKSANQAVERVATGGRHVRNRARWAAAIAHFLR